MGPVAVSRDSSVGRAEDCSTKEAILRSLVRIRFARIFFFRTRNCVQLYHVKLILTRPPCLHGSVAERSKALV